MILQDKLKVDGIVDTYKAGLVDMGFSQLERIDFEETFIH